MGKYEKCKAFLTPALRAAVRKWGETTTIDVAQDLLLAITASEPETQPEPNGAEDADAEAPTE